VTDLRNFGFFVDVMGLAMSGLVPLSTMKDDFYIYDEQRNQLMGRRTRRVIRLGDQLEVQVATVDTAKKQVDFRLAVKAGDVSKAPVKSNPPARQNPYPSSRGGQGGRRHRRGRR
jgi:ribonuclease R